MSVNETLRCIAETDIVVDPGEQLCIAYRTSTWVIGAGVSLRDHGHVLGVVAPSGGQVQKYYPLTKEDIATNQATGALPTPMPEYEIPLTDYLYGYSLWIFLVLAIAGAWYWTGRNKPAPEE